MMVRLPDEYGTERWINPDRVRSLTLHPVGEGEWVLNITAGGKGETATGTEAQMRALARKITGHHEDASAQDKQRQEGLRQRNEALVEEAMAADLKAKAERQAAFKEGMKQGRIAAQLDSQVLADEAEAEQIAKAAERILLQPEAAKVAAEISE